MKTIRRNLCARLVLLVLLGWTPCLLLACSDDSRLPQVPDGLGKLPIYNPQPAPTPAPAKPAVQPEPEPAPAAPRALELVPGRIEQLLQYASDIPTREAIATWPIGADTLRVFTRHREQLMEEPSERMGVASVHETVQVIVARGALEEIVLEKTIANMLSLEEQETLAVFAALDGDALRLAIDSMPRKGVIMPSPGESVRARAAWRSGRLEVSNRWQGKLTQVPASHELLPGGVPWPKDAVALSADGSELVFWDATWKALHRQPAPRDARLHVTRDGVIVATPSERTARRCEGACSCRASSLRCANPSSTPIAPS
jgi:hypothetical protein